MIRFWIERMDCGISDVVSAMTPEAVIKCDAANFECNICFQLAQDPIVTLCGHLYCWACLYQWLQIHSHSHECPVCKALVEEDKLVPIYGRGNNKSRPHQLIPGVDIPNRPIGQRPQTAPPVDINYFRHQELDPTAGYSSPMATARFGNLTLSALFGAIPAFFNLQVHGFHDATVYGATTGVPYMFSSSFHGGYIHGFNHSSQVEGTRLLLKMLFLIFGFVLIMLLIC